MRARERLTVDLPADSFAIVMATGIVSVAALDGGHRVPSAVLVALAGSAFCVLVAAAAYRLGHTGRAFAGDPADLTRAFGLFSFVAAGDVLDARLGSGPLWVVAALGAVALTGWLLIVPRVWFALRSTLGSGARRVASYGARGSWLLATVATESLALTAAELVRAGTASRVLLVASLCWWLLGLLVYVAIAVPIVWRLAATRLDPRALHPDSWVLMGALAIATVAGSTLVRTSGGPEGLPWLPPLVAPTLVALWGIATAWIPLLVAGEVWRVRRVPPRYERARWATVFPLGMYAAASHALPAALRAAGGVDPDLVAVSGVLSHAFFWVALAAWCATAAGLARAGWRGWRATHGAPA